MSTVDSVVGVLCTRVRLEEKRLISALGLLGVDVKPLPPSDAPLPIQPLTTMAVSGDFTGSGIAVVVDRLQNRTTAAVWLPYWQRAGCAVIGAGVAATLDRLAIARLLAEAGFPRPETALVISETSGLNAIDLFEGTGTLLPLETGKPELPLADREIAEAVLEHREVLGDAPQAIALLQQGLAAAGNRLELIVAGGKTIAVCGEIAAELTEASMLAERVANLLDARLIGVTLTVIDGRLVIWDITPVPEFRSCQPVGDITVEQAIAAMALDLTRDADATHMPIAALIHEEVGGHVVLSA